MPDYKPMKREFSNIQVEILPLGELRDQAVHHYISLVPERGAWSQEKRDRLVIRTEAKWGRVHVRNENPAPGEKAEHVYLLNELGNGPKAPLSSSNLCMVELYAALSPDKASNDPGFFERTPFCRVPINEETALKLKSTGLVKLEDFILQTKQQYDEAYQAWTSCFQNDPILRAVREKQRAARARKAASSVNPAATSTQPTEIPIGESEGEQGPRIRA